MLVYIITYFDMKIYFSLDYIFLQFILYSLGKLNF